MNKPKSAFLDYRSPYVWQSRALNFNKQLIKKLNHIQKGNLKQTQLRSKRIGIAQQHHANGAFRHRLLELSASNSSSASFNSSTVEDREDAPFAKSFFPKFHNASKMARNYMDNTCNTSRANGHFVSHGAFSSSGSRCPVHGIATHHPAHLGFKHAAAGHSHFDSSTHFSAEYSLQPSHQYFSMPYHSYLSHYPHYYSSHMYMPSSYLPLQYHLSPSMYGSKHLPSALHHHHHYQQHHPAQQQQPQRPRNQSFEYGSNVRTIQADERHENKCRGHLVVLVIILTVITIGVVMGIILAVTIN